MRSLALALLATTACSLAPRYERPAAPVDSRFEGDAGTGVGAVDRGWRDVFADARLQSLIALALANNRDLRVATLNVEAARAQHRITRSQLLPQVGAIGSANIASADPRFPAAADPQTLYRVGVSASWELDLFGRVRSQKEAALQEYFATIEARRAAQLSLVAEVATQYLRERAFDEQRVLAEQTVTLVEQSQELTQRLLEAGQRSDLDARTAEAQVAAAKAEVARLTRLQVQARNALVLLVGAPLPASLPSPRPLAEQTIVADIPAGLPSDLLQRRPDILAAEHALRAANANIGAARAAFFPTISLTGFAGLVSTTLSGLVSGGAFAWSVAPEATLPIFTGGRNAANLDLAKVRARIEVAQYERAIQVAFREVADGLVARTTFDEQLAAQLVREAAERRRFEISETRYRNGIESYVVVLAAQQDLYAAQHQLIELRFARMANLATLYTVLGGGWLERGQRQVSSR